MNLDLTNQLKFCLLLFPQLLLFVLSLSSSQFLRLSFFVTFFPFLHICFFYFYSFFKHILRVSMWWKQQTAEPRYYVHFQKKYLWERCEPPYPPSYGLDSNTTVLLGEWLWYAMKPKQSNIFSCFHLFTPCFSRPHTFPISIIRFFVVPFSFHPCSSLLFGSSGN